MVGIELSVLLSATFLCSYVHERLPSASENCNLIKTPPMQRKQANPRYIYLLDVCSLTPNKAPLYM